VENLNMRGAAYNLEKISKPRVVPQWQRYPE